MTKILEIKAEKGEEFEAKETLIHFTTNAILSCAFGVETNSFSDPDDIFFKQVIEVKG